MTDYGSVDVGLDEQQPHVVAFNIWKGNDIAPAPADALGLRIYSIVLPRSAELQRVTGRVRSAGIPLEEATDGLVLHDPSHISLMLTDRMMSPN